MSNNDFPIKKIDFEDFFGKTPEQYLNLKSCCVSFRISAINNIPVVFFGEAHHGYVDGNVMNMCNEYLPYIYFRCGRRLASAIPARICLFLEADARNHYNVDDDNFTKGFGEPTLGNFIWSRFYNNKLLRKAVFPDLKIIYSDFMYLLQDYLGYRFYQAGKTKKGVEGHFVTVSKKQVEDIEKLFDYLFDENNDTFDINRNVLLTKYVSSVKRILHSFDVKVRARFITVYVHMIYTLKNTYDAITKGTILMRLRDLNLFIYFFKSLFKQRYDLYLFWVGGDHIVKSFNYFLNQFNQLIQTETLYDSRDNYNTDVFPMKMLENVMETHVYSKFLNREHFLKNFVLRVINAAEETASAASSEFQDTRINKNDEEIPRSSQTKRKRK